MKIKNIMIILSVFIITTVNAKQTTGRSAAIAQQVSVQPQGTTTTTQITDIDRLYNELMNARLPWSSALFNKYNAAKNSFSLEQNRNLENRFSSEKQKLSSEEWMNTIFALNLMPTLKDRMEEIKKLEQFSLTPQQRSMLENLEAIVVRDIAEKKQSMAQQVKLAKELAKERQRKKGVKAGWFDWLWGAEWGITAYKDMIKDKLNNGEKYPTVKVKQEALELDNEFSEPGYDDVRTMISARNELKNELGSAESPDDKKINDLIAQLRDEFGFDLSVFVSINDLKPKMADLRKYIQNIKQNTENFVKKNITNENATALLKAITSELKRINAIIDILNAKVQVPTTSVSGENVPQGQPVTQQPAQNPTNG